MSDCFYRNKTGKCANPALMHYGQPCYRDSGDRCTAYAERVDCKYWEPHTGKCLNGDSENFGEECYDPRLECYRADSETPYDQSAKADAGKPRLTLVPRKIIWAIAKVREFGMKKYREEDNWKRVEVRRYRDAAFRHFLAYLDDPSGKDPESGLPILYHVVCNLAFLIELENYEEED